MSVLHLRASPLTPLRAKSPLSLFLPRTFLTPPSGFLTVVLSSTAEKFQAQSETLPVSPRPSVSLGENLDWVSRTRLCGEITGNDVGERVRLCGWVALHRVHGGLTFVNLRDHTGTVQVMKLFNFCCDEMLGIWFGRFRDLMPF